MPFEAPAMRFGAEIGGICEHAGQHGGYILRRISRPDMRELIGESGPFMHLPEQIRDFDQWIRFADFGIESFSRGGNVAYPGRHDQRSVLHPHALELSVAGAPGQPLQVEVHHLPDLGQPSRTVARHAETQFVFFLECDEGRLRHQIFIDRPE
ncbi:hypothetical protein GCM10007919_66800 [Rhizobium indigoferae]|nr:hypothetical protein GCM10007919_66800 [Rhizobium indigoferae]